MPKSVVNVRTLYHLRLGLRQTTDKFCKKIIQLPGLMSTTLACFKGD